MGEVEREYQIMLTAFEGVSPIARNAVRRAVFGTGIDNMDVPALRQFVKDQGKAGLLKHRGLGKKSAAELVAWADR